MQQNQELTQHLDVQLRPTSPRKEWAPPANPFIYEQQYRDVADEVQSQAWMNGGAEDTLLSAA